MSVTIASLTPGMLISDSGTTVYTSTGVRTIIDKFTVTNTDNSARTVTVYIMPNGQLTVADRYIITSAKSVDAGEAVELTELKNHILESGDYIVVVANAANVVSVRASGRKVTL